MSPSSDSYEVVWPLAPSRRTEQRLSDRPVTLDGVRVGFVWDYIFKGDRMFEAAKEQMKAASPTVEFVDYPAFGNIHGSSSEERSSVEDLPSRLEQLGVDEVVVGVGA